MSVKVVPTYVHIYIGAKSLRFKLFIIKVGKIGCFILRMSDCCMGAG
jgi:hypothetical protein